MADNAAKVLPSNERIEEWAEGARKVLADELPAGHKLWKSWAFDLADQVLALVRRDHQIEEAREEALRVADDLLRRLSEWDMLYVKPDGSGITADAPYWQGEIKRTRDYIAGARA